MVTKMETFNVTFKDGSVRIETNIELGANELQSILEKIQSFWNYKYEFDYCDKDAYIFKKI